MDSWKITPKNTSYRFLNRWSKADLKHQTFCSYYRLVVLNILKVFMIGMILPSMVVAFALITGVILPERLNNFYGVTEFNIAVYGFLCCMLCILGIFAGIFYSIGLGITWLVDWLAEKRQDNKKESNPNIVWTWIKTKKQKFCPFVEIIKE
jgi:hypothetical protein